MNFNKTKDRLYFLPFAIILGIALLLAGCRTPQVVPPAPPPATQTTPAATPSASPQPTATPQPLAAQINGEDLPLAILQAEIVRLQTGRADIGLVPLPEEQAATLALNELISQTLLAQAAYADGYQSDESALNAWLQEMRTARADTWETWLKENAYPSEDHLLTDLRRQAAAAWQRERILAAVPETMLQVHARQILLYNLDTAQNVYAQLQQGADFASLAAQYNPLTLGDLGWFPRGYLPIPQVEAAAFALQPGAYSDIIESDLGYHILQTLEKDDARALSDDARLVLQAQALKTWLQNRRQNSVIILYPP
ncbi:MAG: hypothetical protein Fur0018_15160 [Anaerolineales bacterium]